MKKIVFTWRTLFLEYMRYLVHCQQCVRASFESRAPMAHFARVTRARKLRQGKRANHLSVYMNKGEDVNDLYNP